MPVSDEVKIRILTDTAKSLKDLAALGLSFGSVALAVKQVVKFLGESEQAFFKSEQSSAKLNAVLRSTGGAAGFTAGELESMARGLQKVTTFEDDTIVSAQAVLATFTKIGRDVFPKAVEAALDMSTVMGQDLQSSIVQIGKALNDPIEGVSALRRVGVQLTDQQEAQIKAFMESGQVMEAQKLILSELNTEFGGAAKTMGETAFGASVKLQNAFGALKEAMGANVAEGMKPFREWLAQIVDGLAASMENAQALKEVLVDGFVAADQPIDRLNKALASVDERLEHLRGPGGGMGTGGGLGLDLGLSAGLESQRALIIAQIRELERVTALGKGYEATQAEQARKARELADYLKEVADLYAQTPEGKAEALLGDIAKWEKRKESAVYTKEQVEAILKMLRDQLPVAEEIVETWEDAGGVVLPPVVEAFRETEASMREQYQTVMELAAGIERTAKASEQVKEVWSEIPKSVDAAFGILKDDFLSTVTSMIGMFGPEGQVIAAFIDRVKEMLDDGGWGESLSSGIEGIFADAMLSGDWDSVQEALQGQIKKSIVDALIASEVMKPQIDHFRDMLKVWLFAPENDAARDAVRDAYNQLLAAGSQANDLIQDLLGSVPFAEGGIVTRPTRALIGEAGPEAVIPLNQTGGLGSTIIVQGSLIAERELDSRVAAAVARKGRGW